LDFRIETETLDERRADAVASSSALATHATQQLVVELYIAARGLFLCVLLQLL